MASGNLRLNRQQLAQFLPNHEAIKAFEQLFSNVLDETPSDIEGVELAANTAQLQAAEALGRLSEIANVLSLALYGAYRETAQQDNYMPPDEPAKVEEAYTPPIALEILASLPGKEASIAAGTIAQYWRGDKSWRDFATDVRASVLTGLSTATNAVITAADTVLSAFGKIQKQISDHFAAVNVHGVSAAVVGTTDAQTLTNKTLTTPVINGFSGTGNGSITGDLSVSGNASFGGATNPGWGTSWKLVGLGPSNIYQATAFGELDTYAGVYRNNSASRLNNGTSGGAGTEVSFTSVAQYIFAPGVNGAAATISAYSILTATGLEIAGALTTSGGSFLHKTTSALTNGAGASVGTLTNAPVAGNPTKWIAINDNGTTRYIPTW